MDQGALDFAMIHGLECSGWCPKNRQSETGRIPEIYPLQEVEVDDYNERTRRNVRDANATLIITAGGQREKGTSLTIKHAEESGKPYFHIELPQWNNLVANPGRRSSFSFIQGLSQEDRALIDQAKSWLSLGSYNVLNVAGNRESTSPGIQKFTIRILEYIFEME